VKNNKYYIVSQDLFLCDASGQLRILGEAEFLGLDVSALSQHIFYSDASHNFVVVELPGGIDAVAGISDYQWQNLRSQLGLLPEVDFQLAGRALQILRWHYDHQYCGRCGGATQTHERDLARRCTRCSLDFYPRLSPCIITLVTRGDYCLLAWHSRSKNRRYSCLAGFIEPGETPEETLVREVWEEVALKVKNLRYHSSQAWPFPGQLMLGYFAEYDSGDINPDPTEIIEADWFHIDQLPEIPPPATISGRLIDAFIKQRKS
jgi:NAD+ diphosphatase